MSLPQSSEGKPLIPESRIRHFGPKRLKPMQGVRLNPKTKLWEPKFAKKTPDALARKNLLARQAAEKKKVMPAEQKVFDLRRYRPPPGRVLLRVGRVITHDGAIELPQSAQWADQEFTVVSVGWLRIGSLDNAPFKVGDRVFLDAKSHKRPIELPGHPAMVLVKIARVAAVVSS